MSKSHAKTIFIGMCYGHNTPYYKLRRRLKRSRNRHYLRQALQFIEIDENLKDCNMPTRNSWEEPTDGGRKYTTKEMRKKLNKYYNGIYIDKKFNKIKK